MLRKAVSITILISVALSCASADWYFSSLGDWSTGLRQSMNLSMLITGSSLGEGTFYRYSDFGANDVRASERISSARGVIDLEEVQYLRAVVPRNDELIETATGSVYATPNIDVYTVKPPGSRIYTQTVRERWPVFIVSDRSIDYKGIGITDRDFFINQKDYTGSSFMGATDLHAVRKTRMQLLSVWFQAAVDGRTNKTVFERFRPNSAISYQLSSISNGTATLKYLQSEDKMPALEGIESYTGKFNIDRSMTIGSKITLPPEKRFPALPGYPFNPVAITHPDDREPWLECCTLPPDKAAFGLQPLDCIFGGC